MKSASILFGQSSAIQRALAEAEQFAPSEYPVLILGQPGTGKTLLARHLHASSCRRGAFIRCAVGSLPDELRHSELFGHAKGAFTGAFGDRMGLLEAAHQGTFFLDEIALASPALQGTLLTFLDEPAVRRIGEQRSRPVRVRFVAATNADLREDAAAGRFRQDLLDRFGFFEIRLPALAERRSDIVPLFRHFLEAECLVAGRLPVAELDAEVCDLLRAAPWPGNVRELRAVAEYVATKLRARSEPICVEHLPRRFLESLPAADRHLSRPRGAQARRALEDSSGNKAEAARRMGVSRRHFYRLLEASPGATSHVTPLSWDIDSHHEVRRQG